MTQKVWNSGLKVLEKCPCGDRKIKIKLEPNITKKIKEISAQNKDTEFLVYLDGKKTKDTFIVDKLIYPKQNASGVHVQVLESVRSMGVLHKHPWPGAAWFSGTDDEYINANHDFSIVIDADNVANSVARIRSPCTGGNYLMVPATVDGLKNVDTNYGNDSYVAAEDDLRKLWEKLPEKIIEQIEKLAPKLTESLDTMFWIQRGKEKLSDEEDAWWQTEKKWGNKGSATSRWDPLGSFFGRKWF